MSSRKFLESLKNAKDSFRPPRPRGSIDPKTVPTPKLMKYFQPYLNL